MKHKNLIKSISVIFMLLAMLFSCDQLTDEITNNSGNNTTQDGGNNNSGDNNSGNENGSENNGGNSNTEKPAEKITITFDLNGIDETLPAAIETTSDKSVDLPVLTNAKFSHWNTKADGSGLSYNGTTTFSENTTLYAILRPENAYKITYELNGGENETSAPYYFTENNYIYLKNPIKDGCIFGGWYNTSDFSNKEIVVLPPFDENGNAILKDIILYAKWYDNTSEIKVATSDVVDKISTLSAGAYKLIVTGAIDNSILVSLKTAMNNNPEALITLDLSETTGLTCIDEYTFQNCNNLISITIPFGVTDINYYAFAWCGNLTNVTIPNSVTSIGDSAFWGCRKLISINIPKSVTEVSYYAFIYCNSLTKFDVDTNHKNFSTSDDGKSLYNKDKTELIAYPGASGNITILDGVTSIHGGIFNYNSDLTSVVIPDSVTTIGDVAFSGCSGLTNVTIPDSVTSIGDEAFSWISSLTSITIPDSVTTIREGAFSGCYNLVTFDVNVNNGKYSASDDGKILYNRDKTELIGYPSASGDVEIPKGTISIEKDAFAGCYNLTSVVIPDSVTTIGDSTFNGCSNLTDITIGNGVISIGMMAFNYNPNLVNMIFKNTVGWCSKSIYNGACTTIDVSDAVSIAADFASGKYDEYYLYKE